MKIKKYKQKLKGGFVNIDINHLIDCIIIKKASILAFYYYYYNKEIKNIDDFLDDLFETKIEGYIINNLLLK